MAIAGSATQCFDMQVVDGKVRRGTYALRQNVEMDADEAVRRLLAGDLVHVHAYDDKVRRVRLAVEAELAKRGEVAPSSGLWPDARIDAELDKCKTDADDLALMRRIRDDLQAVIDANGGRA